MNPDFQFLRPWWLLALLPFWLLAWRYLLSQQRGGAWSRVCDAALLPFVLEYRPGRARRGGGVLLALAGSLVITALAGPVWEHVPVPVFRSESALVLALDLSGSMNAADLEPSRLARAKFKIADILRLREDGQTALVVYAAQSFVVTPLTDDSATIVAQLQALDSTIMPNQGSEPATALERASELLNQAGVPSGHVLLLSDGADPAALARAGALAAEANYRLSVLALGTAQGAPIPDAGGGFVKDAAGTIVMSALDGAALRALAVSGRGVYLEQTNDDSDVHRLLDFLDADRTHDAQRLAELTSQQWREFGPWLLLPVLPFAALAFRRGILVLLAALLLPLPREASADWWHTPDQSAQQAFEHGDYATAAQRFETREWRAAARYRAGDYAGALADFAESDGAAAHYNRGNALARLGRYEEAVAAYARALEQAPADADAAHNKALIEKLLAAEQQPPPDSGQDGKQDPSEQAAEPSEDQGGESQMSGGQDDAEQRNNVSAGNAGGGADGEQQQTAEATAGERQAGGAESQDERVAPPTDDELDELAGEQAQLAAGDAAADAEQAQATEQWLRQIPDDPAGLLRRKFQYQYKQLYGNQPYDGDRW